MNKTLTILALGASLFAGLALPAQAAEVSLARFDCGTPQAPTPVNERFSDTYAYGDLKIQFVFSCYLIKHGDDVFWKVSITNPMPLTLEFTGKVAGDSISGEMGIGPMGSFPFTGTRA